MIDCSITLRLIYCNGLLYGVKGNKISQLQLCQNNYARMLSFWLKLDRITPVLKTYTGCLLSKIIKYKVLLVLLCIYIVLHNKAPTYLPQLLSICTPNRPLRSEIKISSLFKDAVCKDMADAVLRMPLQSFGTPSLHMLIPASSVDAFKSSPNTYRFNLENPSTNWLLFCMSFTNGFVRSVW